MKHIIAISRNTFIAIENGRRTLELPRQQVQFESDDILEAYEMSDGYPDGKQLVATVTHIKRCRDYDRVTLGYVSKTMFVSRIACRKRLGMSLAKPSYKDLSYRQQLLEDCA